MSRKPPTEKITITRGDTDAQWYTYKDATGAAVNLTGYSFLAQIRRSTESAVLVAYTITIPTQTGSDVGRFKRSLTASQTAALPLSGGVWDLQMTDTLGVVTTMVGESEVEILADVSRAE